MKLFLLRTYITYIYAASHFKLLPISGTVKLLFLDEIAVKYKI